MDLTHWLPGWVEGPRDVRLEMARELGAGSRRIFEGGLPETCPMRSGRADLVVFLDLPVAQRLWRMLRRRVQYARGARRLDLPPDCPERLSWEFVRWIVATARRNRRRRLALFAAFPPGKGVRLKGQRDAKRWIARMAEETPRT